MNNTGHHLILRATGVLALIGLAATVLTNSATMALTTPSTDHLSLAAQLQTQCGACHTGQYAHAPDFRQPGVLAARAHLAAARIRSAHTHSD